MQRELVGTALQINISNSNRTVCTMCYVLYSKIFVSIYR